MAHPRALPLEDLAPCRGWLRRAPVRAIPGDAMEPCESDPRPVAPEKPLPSDCCEGGCDRCVYDVYADELAEYERALAAWQERQ